MLSTKGPAGQRAHTQSRLQVQGRGMYKSSPTSSEITEASYRSQERLVDDAFANGCLSSLQISQLRKDVDDTETDNINLQMVRFLDEDLYRCQ